MANNYLQPGKVIPLTAPYNRTSGQGALVGSVFGVAQVDVLINVVANFALEGMWYLTKLSTEEWTVGAAIYWDDTNKRCTTESSGNTKIGVATAVTANPSASGYVRLNGAF